MWRNSNDVTQRLDSCLYIVRIIEKNKWVERRVDKRTTAGNLNVFITFHVILKFLIYCITYRQDIISTFNQVHKVGLALKF